MMALPALNPVTVNDPEVCPAAIVTDDGETVATLGAELVRLMVTPEAGAGWPSATLPGMEPPGLRGELESVRVVAPGPTATFAELPL